MKLNFLYILTILFLVSCKKHNEETPKQESQPTYYNFSGEIGTNDNSTLVSYDNNLMICGNSDTNISILKISISGNQIWRKDFFAGYSSRASSIVESSNHELFICGYTSRNLINTKRDFLLIKTNSNGDTLWTKTYGGIKDDIGYQIIKTNDDNILLCGISYSYTTESFWDIYLIKVNTNGDTLWTKTYPDQDQEIPFHLIQTSNGEFLVTGTNEDNSNPRGLYLLKVNSGGEKLWDKTIGPGLWKWGYSTIELSNGDLLTCGQYTSAGYSQVLVLKTDNQGNTIWEKEYGTNNLSEKGNSIKQNYDGTYTITGSSYDVNTMQDDIILFKIDQNGNQDWFKKFGGSETDWGINLIKETNDDNIVTGNYNGGIFMTKTDNEGSFK